ncbi:hypothetical protein AG1IA_02690 [Rhizoctonia solani AG-1 IA]|uniref:Uncharacterized protein n=1 Tax=Thanatephorus cucumeris (strain AG1-IA) TaxID=983506 RepID=L8X2H4_THACA|nr:hypothetical protein AG1IA_02690 [Rhizoctonia solani AG-1 IA]
MTEHTRTKIRLIKAIMIASVATIRRWLEEDLQGKAIEVEEIPYLPADRRKKSARCIDAAIVIRSHLPARPSLYKCRLAETKVRMIELSLLKEEVVPGNYGGPVLGRVYCRDSMSITYPSVLYP